MATEISSDGEYELPPLPPAVKEPPVIPVVIPERPEFNSVTDYTHARRLDLAEKLSKNIANEDPKVINAYLKTLDGMDKAVVMQRRLGIEEAAQQTAEEESKQGAELLKAISRKLLQSENGPVNRAIPSLDDSIPAPELVPGETDIGVANMSYDSFSKGLPNADGES